MSLTRTMDRRAFMRSAGVAGLGAALGAVGAGPGATSHASANAVEQDPARYVDVQLVNITDLHGYLQPADLGGHGVLTDARGERIAVGGVGYLATHLKRIRAGRRNSIFFAAGDSFSGWPFDVDAHENEPTVEVLNALGLQFSTVGNHELDRDFPEYLIDHMEKGIPYVRAGVDDAFVDSTGRRFPGARFRYYTSNMVYSDSGYTIVPPYNVEWVDAGGGRRLPIGFIHLTVFGAERATTSYQPALTSLDEIATVNAYAAELKRGGVNAIVVNMHDGGIAGHDFNGSTDPTGPCFALARHASPDIAAIVTGHWHQGFNAMIPGPDGVPRPVVEAGYWGRLVNEITLKLDPGTGEVIRELTTSTNHPNSHDVPVDPGIQRIADYWTAQGARRWRIPLATQTGDFTRAANAFGESTMGDLAADFVHWSGNRRGSRADLGVVAADPDGGANAVAGDLRVRGGAGPGDEVGRILLGEAWTAFGYGNPVLTVSVTGAQIHTALEQQWRQRGTSVRLVPLAVSGNVSYVVDPRMPVGRRVDPARITIDGAALDLGATYRLAALCDTLIGADGTTAFAGFTNPVRADRDHEGFIAFLRARSHIAPAPLNRVRAAPSGDGTDG